MLDTRLKTLIWPFQCGLDGMTLYLVFPVIVIVISAIFSVQSYMINIAEITMTMTGKKRYNAPPLVWHQFQFKPLIQLQLRSSFSLHTQTSSCTHFLHFL